MISFIITAYNRPSSLRTCLSSLIDQTYPAWDAVVVDNSDSTTYTSLHQDLCDMDKRIHYKYVRSQTAIAGAMHTHSLYKATDIGIGHTTGEWLAFPNDDSYYCPWYAERMLKAAEHQAWDLVYCDIVGGTPAGGHFWLRAEPKLCSIDKTNFMLRREWYTGFPAGPQDYPHADGLMIESLVARGIRHGRVPQILAVHN